jgi:hypothetical protein
MYIACIATCAFGGLANRHEFIVNPNSFLGLRLNSGGIGWSIQIPISLVVKVILASESYIPRRGLCPHQAEQADKDYQVFEHRTRHDSDRTVLRSWPEGQSEPLGRVTGYLEVADPWKANNGIKDLPADHRLSRAIPSHLGQPPQLIPSFAKFEVD